MRSQCLPDLVRLCVVAFSLLTIAGCQVMDSSISYETRPDGSMSRRCNSALGSYSLPISTIKVTVVQDYKGANAFGGPRLNVAEPEQHPDPDPNHLYCLDFLENGFSDDAVTVAYSGQGDTSDLPSQLKATGMLSVIASKSIDRTGDVIRNLIRAIFVIASRDADFGRAATDESPVPVTRTEQSVNPFDLEAMAALNRSLRDYGYCLTFGDYTYNTNELTADAYCNNPRISLAPKPKPPLLEVAESQRYLVDKLPTGIFYRPRQPYSMFVYVRDDPDRGGAWELRKIDTVMLENLSPILVLKVNRAIFAEYRTALAFDNGNLVDVCVGKGSEVSGALEIPLDIVYGLVSLPSDTLVQEIENKRYTAEYIAAQSKLITLQNSILAAPAGTFPGASDELTGSSLSKDGEDLLTFAHRDPITTTSGNIVKEQADKFDSLCPLLQKAGASL